MARWAVHKGKICQEKGAVWMVRLWFGMLRLVVDWAVSPRMSSVDTKLEVAEELDSDWIG